MSELTVRVPPVAVPDLDAEQAVLVGAWSHQRAQIAPGHAERA